MTFVRLALAVVAGGAACIYLDWLHATHGVTVYYRHDLGIQPWWVLLLFPAAVFVTVVTVEPIRKALRGAPVSRPNAGRLIADFGLFAGAYALTSFLHDRPNLLAAILFTTWLGRVVGREPLWVFLFSIGSGIGGFLVEAALIALHQFAYVNPDWLGVARWLPGIYVHAGLLGVTLAGLIRRDEPAV